MALLILAGVGLFIYWHKPRVDLISWLHEDIGRYFVLGLLILLTFRFFDL